MHEEYENTIIHEYSIVFIYFELYFLCLQRGLPLFTRCCSQASLYLLDLVNQRMIHLLWAGERRNNIIKSLQ